MNLYFNTERSVFFLDQTLLNVCWRMTGGIRVGTSVANDPVPPSYSSTASPKFNTDKIAFGDGYEEVSESGIRPVRRSFQLKWNRVPDVQAKALMRFLCGEGTHSIYNRRVSEWFYWLPPLQFHTTANQAPIRMTCLEAPSCTAEGWNSNTLTATFTESFEL